MSPFTIFAIVVTVGCLIYYGAIIFIDLNSKSKKAEEQGDNIPVWEGLPQQQEESFTPMAVVENANGGFDFYDQPELTIAEAAQENTVAEVPAEQTDEAPNQNDTTPVQEAPSTVDPRSTPAEESKEPIPSEPTSTEVPLETDENAHGEEEPDETKESSEEEPNGDDELKEESIENLNITMVEFSETPSLEAQKKTEPFDESKAFDSDRARPQYSVTTVYEGNADMAIKTKVDSTTSKQTTISINEDLKSQQDMLKEIREKRTQTKITYKDEVTNV